MSADGALHLVNALVTDTGARWGDLASDWQVADVRAVLCPGADDARQHWLGRPKGGSKSTDVGAILLAWLIEQAGDLEDGYTIAADVDQANRLLDRVRGFVRRTPQLGAAVSIEKDRIVNARTGAKVHALAADVAGGEGLLSPFLVCEELPNWADTATARGMWTVAASSVPKWPGCRLVVIGHAGSPSHWSHRIFEHAKTSGAWRVVEVPGPLPWISADALTEQRALLLPSQFERRHLNRWAEAEDRLSTRDDVLACVTPGGGVLAAEAGLRYVVGLDIGLRNDATVAAVCSLGRRDEGTSVVLDRIEAWVPSRGREVDLAIVAAWLEETSRLYNRAEIIFDPYQAIHLAQDLRSRGVRMTEFTFSPSSIARLALTLHRLLAGHLLDLPDDDELVDELSNVQLRETSPGQFRLDHDPGQHDDRAIALALAARHLLDVPPQRRLRVRGACPRTWTA